MSVTAKVIESIAQRIMTHENASGGGRFRPFTDIIQIFDKLRKVLSKLAGEVGYASLLKRSLTMAMRQSETLNVIRIRDDGALEITVEPEKKWDLLLEEAAALSLLSQFFSLLFLFIGEPMTVNLLRDVWPDIPIDTDIVPMKEKP